MRKTQEQKKYLKILLIGLLIITIGIGYAILTQKISVDGSITYDSIKWDVGYKSATDGGGTISSNPVISTDKKAITINCNVDISTDSETCIAAATIENNSTFDVELSRKPKINYNNIYIESVYTTWIDTSEQLKALDVINANTTKQVKITIKTKEITNSTIPPTGLSVPITVELDWVEKGKAEVQNVLLYHDDFVNGSYYATGQFKTETPYGQLKTIHNFIEPQKIKIIIEDPVNDVTTQDYRVVYSAYDSSGKILNPNDLSNAWYEITTGTLELDLATLYPSGYKFKLDIMRYNGNFFDIPDTATITVLSVE